MARISNEQKERLSSNAKYNQQEKLDREDLASPKFDGKGFDVHKAILEEHILGFGSFARKQALLRFTNPLSGRIFNPLGFGLNLYEHGFDPAIEQLLKQLASDVVGGGLIETTDGKTFSSAADTDYPSSIFKSVEKFKDDVEDTPSLFEGVLNKVKEMVGARKPTRSILGQVLAYDNDDLDNLGSQTKLRDYYEDNEDKPQRIDGNDMTGLSKIEGINENVLDYLYSRDKKLLEPIKYQRLRKKVKDQFYASNIKVRKHNDIVAIEKGNYGTEGKESKKERARNFIQSRVLKLPPIPNDWYENWKFDFSKDYPSPYKIFIGKKHAGFKESIYNLDLDNILTDLDDKWIESEKERINKISHIERKEKPEYPLYNISGKYTLNEIKNEDENINSLYDIRHLNRFIKNKNLNDKVISTDIIGEGEEPDLETNLYLSFQDIRTGKIAYFRPSIDSITTDIQPTFEDEQFLGRTESLPSYQSTNKSKTFAFKLYCGTPKEQLLNIKKLNFLDSLCYPIHNHDHSIIRNPLIKINIGTYFKNVGGYITSMTHTINNDEAGWTIDKENNFMAPKIIDVSISMVIIHNRMPFYDEGERFESGGNGETNFQNNYGINYSNILNES